MSDGVTGGAGGGANLGQLPIAPERCDLETSNSAWSIFRQCAFIICSKPAAGLHQFCSTLEHVTLDLEISNLVCTILADPQFSFTSLCLEEA